MKGLASQIGLSGQSTFSGDGPRAMNVGLTPASFADTSANWTVAARRTPLPLRHFCQDAEWLAAGTAPPDEILTLTDGTHGELNVHVHDSSIELRLAGVRLLRRRIRRFNVYENVATDRPEARPSIENALVTLGQKLPANGAIFLEAVPMGSDLHAAVEMPSGRIARSLYVLPWATTTLARLRWPGTLEQYLKGLGHSTRKDLKRNDARFMGDASIAPEVKGFAAPVEVEAFMKDAVAVSSTTYQRRLLDRGLVAGSKEEAQIRFAAAKGAFLGHILYANGVAIAYQYGLLYNGTYFCEQTGYDPKWAPRQPGAVLFMEGLRDLEKRKTDIKVMDFGQGMNMFKERTTNERHAITHYYLFPRTASGFVLYSTAKAMSRTVKLLSTMLERLKLREAIRVLQRRWTGHGHMQ
jgi:hypothetical protein